MDLETRRARLWLAATDQMTPERWRAMGLMYDSPLSLWQDFGPHSMPPPLYEALQKKRDVAALDRMLETMEALDMRLLWFEDEDFPPLLREIEDPPLALFARGEADLSAPRAFAIVGSRVCTRYGKTLAGDIARDLADAGVLVVSGLARGIDVAANVACAEAGRPTVAVLGCGLDLCYPPEHGVIAERILAAGGAVVSEYPPGMPPLAHHFPQRNRIISGLCAGLLLVEASGRSGSMITVRLALDQGREVFVLPGQVGLPTSTSPLKLLREGATPATCALDILEDLKWTEPLPGFVMRREDEAPAREVPLSALEPDHQRVVSVLMEGPLAFGNLLEETGFSVPELNSHLTMLELEEIIEQLPGRSYALRTKRIVSTQGE